LKTVVIISDLHCGALTGLTSEQYRISPAYPSVRNVQETMWNWYKGEIDKLGQVDFLIVNGDAIDGKANKLGGRGLITADRSEQVDIAKDAIDYVNASKIAIIKGTRYHVGDDEDWEEVLAERVNADKVGIHDWYQIDDVIIDCKHKVGSSSIPHGRYTAIAREKLWNDLWAERGLQPNADILIRSHCHYFVHCGDAKSLRIITPALQWSTDFGSREMSGTIDVGFIVIKIEGDSYIWQPKLLDLTFDAPELVRI
jgi:hypothetical protein